MLPRSNYKRVMKNGKIERVWIGEGEEPKVENKVDVMVEAKNCINDIDQKMTNLSASMKEINKRGIARISKDLDMLNRKHF